MTDKQPAPEPEYIEPEYIITESQFESLELIAGDIATNGGENDQRIILEYIKSRPYHPAPENIHTCIHKEIRNEVEFCHYYDDRINRQSEREKVLNELLSKIRSHKKYQTYCEYFTGEQIEGMIESLRRKVE